MKQEDLPSLIKRVHDNAVKHGWHDQKRSEEHWLMMIVTEIAELVEADRKHRYAKPFVIGIYQSNQKIYTEFGECGEEQFQRFFEAYIKDTVQDELADVCIRIFDMFGELDYKPNNLCFLDFSVEPNHYFAKESITEQCYTILKELFTYSQEFHTTAENLVFCLCRCREFACAHNIDLDWHIEQKMRYNELRPYKHGGKEY